MPEAITDNLDLWTSALLTKSTAGRGSNGKLEAYGIKKLRELILELAVRGKLVPQDPNDEPASRLLENIAAEKTRLVKQGVIRKDDSLPAITDEEKLYQIPKSWEWVRLIDVYYSISPSGKKLKTSEIVGEGKHPVVDQGQSFIAGYTNDSELLIVIPGPVVIFGDHTTEIKFIDFDFVAGADGTKILRPYLMDERFFYTYLKSYKLENRGYARHFKVLNDNLYALPPIAEQHRIVAKVDELMAMCDELAQQQTHSIAAHQTLVKSLLGTLTRVETQQEFSAAWARIASYFDTLFTTEASIEQLKQTILQLAVMGKLSNSSLSKRVTLSELIELISGQHLLADEQNTGGRGIPYLTGPSDFGDKHPIPTRWTDSPKVIAQPGDILVTVKGSGVGKTNKLVAGPTAISRQLMAVRVVGANPDFIHLVLQHAAGHFQALMTGIAIPGIGRKDVLSLETNLPPLEEQHRIVAKVDELMALCDTLKARLADAQAIQLNLADAIVEQAIC